MRLQQCIILFLLTGCASLGISKSIESDPAPQLSSGCGVSQAGYGQFTRMTVEIDEQPRTYYLRIPKNYRPNRPYPVIFRWHGAGGDGLSGGLNIENHAKNNAIIVAADGLNRIWRPDTTQADLALFDTMLNHVKTHYCVDETRVFSYGFSAGGSFTNLLACERGSVLRATASLASAPRGQDCTGHSAAWIYHDKDDQAVPIDLGHAARAQALARNQCSAETTDIGDGCVSYAGCLSPVIWCESSGFGHNIRGNYAPFRVWEFFQQFP